MDPEVRERTERWFVSRGTPHFIADYSASRDVFTRTLPALTLVFVAELAGAANLQWPWWANVLAVMGGVAIVVGSFAVLNVLRRRPALTRPQSIDVPELAAFVLVPALLPLVFGGQLRSAALTAAGNLLLLGAIYLGTSYAVVPIIRWAVRYVLRQLGTLLSLLVRALPLLLLFVTFLFINAEVWQVGSGLDGPYFWATVGLFVAVGTFFLLTRTSREVEQLGDLRSWDRVDELVRGSPVDGMTGARPPIAELPGLSRRQRWNVSLVLLFAQGLQVLLVSVVIGAFFVVFGLLAIVPGTIESWTAEAPNRLGDFALWDRNVVLTEELLRVAGFLAAFSGLYFAVHVANDAAYRQEFFEEVAAELRQVFAVRAVYLAELGGHTQP